MASRTVDLGKVVGPAGPNEVSSSTNTALNGVLFGNGSKVGVKTLDTSSLTNDNNHVPTSGVVKSAITKLANPNLLEDWYFKNPVNQRGQSSYSNANANTIDRWKLTSGSVSVGASGITLNGTLVQILEHSIGETVVCSALLSDGTMITPTYDDSAKTFTLTASNKTVVAVKLELGSTQTLAHNEGTEANPAWVLNEIPDYGIELLKCQRYLIIPTNEINVRCTTYTANGLYFDMPCPVELAGNPTIGNGLVIRSLDYTAQTGFTFTSTKRGNMNYLRVIAAKNGHGMTDGILSITAWTPISCEP